MTTPPKRHAPWHIAVLIPARNEEALLPRCLHSVLRAMAALDGSATVDVVVVADSCCDNTEHLAKGFLQQHGRVLSSTAGMVGQVRALAAQAAMERCPALLEHCWLANTDADCEVPEAWLQQQLALAMAGWAAVAGIVDVDCFAEHLPVVEARFRSSYVLPLTGGHPHVHGANLGVRADAYLQVGGWGSLSTAEDHDLWSRLRQAGARCLSDRSLQVVTSGRRVGRAPLGFAGALARHNEPSTEGVVA